MKESDFVVERVSTRKTVRVVIDAATYPEAVAEARQQMVASCYVGSVRMVLNETRRKGVCKADSSHAATTARSTS